MRRTKAEALATRESLIDAALEVFLRKGYAAATLQDIAEEAGVTRGAVYWHFNGKEDFYRELYERERKWAVEYLKEVDDTDLLPFDKLKLLVETMVTNFYTIRRFRKYTEFTSFKIEYFLFEEINKSKVETNEFALQKLEKLASEAIEAGSIASHHSAQDISRTLLAFLTGIYRLRFTAPQSFKELKDVLSPLDKYLESLKS